MKGWYYTDDAGERQFEELTEEQAAIDVNLVGEFQGMEGAYARRAEVTKESTEKVALFHEAVGLLPPQRAYHWRLELHRIGLGDEPEKPTANAEQAANAEQSTEAKAA